MFICQFNSLGNIRIMFLLRLSGIFCIYTRLVFCISIQFSNTLVTVRNESRQILAYLMHFCSSSRYVMWETFYSLSHPHILVSIFGIASWFFQQQFFHTFQHQPALHLFQVSALCTRLFVVVFAEVPWSLSCFAFPHFKFMYLLSDYE